MDKAQELEWVKAQRIIISTNLVAAAKRQLQFLAAVDRNRCLYDGPALYRAIYRYKTCWLPLLAKHADSGASECPLVVPLDCEWIWHCHRLNPVQYKTDCQKFYGRILDNQNVESVVQGTSKQQTAEIWSRLFPEEPYEFDINSALSVDNTETFSGAGVDITYDLVSAVKRQSSFFYQVSRPSMHDVRFLEGAVARYKGFLHLIKRNMERSMRRFCVPTYDIDLIWHSHQLQPASYCKDLVEALGQVLGHDDTDSDRTKGKKLDVGFSETTKQWEETFGCRYWRAGAMHRGNAPSPVISTPLPLNCMKKNVIPSGQYHKYLQLPQTKVMEVILEIIGIINLPSEHKGSLFVSFSKNQPDMFFSSRRKLNILAESSGEKQVAAFQCEPTGELVIALMSNSPSNLPISRPAKTMGTTSITLQDLLDPLSKLSVDKWFELVPSSGTVWSKPILLHIAASFTVPMLAPHMFHMVRSCPFSTNTCFFPLPGGVQQLRQWTCVVDNKGNEIMSMQMRNSKKADTRNSCISKREVVGVIGWSGETRVLAEFVGTGWYLMDTHWYLHIEKKSGQDGHIFELRGNQMVKLFPGRKLEYEPQNFVRHKNESNFMTVVRFSAEYPYGKAVALLNLRSGLVKVHEDWFVSLGIVLTFILSEMLRKEGYAGFISNVDFVNEIAGLNEEIDRCDVDGRALFYSALAKEAAVAEEGNLVVPEKGGGRSENCISECGNEVKSSGCGVYENVVKSGGCGGGGGCSGGGGCGGCRGGGCGSCGYDSSGCGACGYNSTHGKNGDHSS